MIPFNCHRCDSKFGPPQTAKLGPLAASGIRYERRLKKALETLAAANNLHLEYQPWFRYNDGKFCSPDFLIFDPRNLYWAIVVEAKRTFYSAANEKLNDLYVPVVERALCPMTVYPLLICQNLSPGCPEPINPSFGIAVGSRETKSSVYHWSLKTPLVW